MAGEKKNVIWTADDDITQLAILGGIFPPDKFQVVEHNSADEIMQKLAVLKTHANRDKFPDAIVTDHDTKSQFSGLDVIEEATKLTIPVVLRSGTKDIENDPVAQKAIGVVKKPGDGTFEDFSSSRTLVEAALATKQGRTFP